MVTLLAGLTIVAPPVLMGKTNDKGKPFGVKPYDLLDIKNI